jgi:hypothetical protein
LFIFLDSSQLWKLDDDKKGKLINKAKIWSSSIEWNIRVSNITPEDNFEYIENDKNETFVLQRGGLNTDYFTLLKDSKSSKVLTATSGNSLEIKGKFEADR